MKKYFVLRCLHILTIMILLIWSVAPILVGLSTSFSTQTEMSKVPAPFWPHRLNFQGYKTLLLSNTEGVNITSEVKFFGIAMRNTIVVTVETVVIVLVVSILAGYAFNRLRFPGRKFLFYTVIGTLPIPGFTLLAPLFRIIANLKLMDTYIGLVLIYLSAIAPLAVWLFYNYVGDLPVEPEEAALIDGCSRFQAFLYVMLPQMGSGIAALTAIVMLNVWGQFLLPLLFAPTLATKPVTVLITEFVGKYTANIPLISAAGMLALIPPAIVALVLNRYIRGMLSGWR
jgi:multiple sugar transport system permease protein